jgi:GNAT superfamily N-acetyltransferase
MPASSPALGSSSWPSSSSVSLWCDAVPVVAADPALDAWWARQPVHVRPEVSARQALVGVLSDEFPAGTVVDLPGERRPSRWQIAVEADVADGRVHLVEVALPGVPLLWYVEVAEPHAAPAATTLVAFSDARYGEGRVLTRREAQAAEISAGHQVAALRWWPATGLAHQIYVQPAYRRRGVAGKLAQAAFGVQVARGLPQLHGDGRRTDLGEQWREGLPDYASWRLAPRSEHLPPMTPGEAPMREEERLDAL